MAIIVVLKQSLPRIAASQHTVVLAVAQKFSNEKGGPTAPYSLRDIVHESWEHGHDIGEGLKVSERRMRGLEVQYHEEKLLTIETMNGERDVRRLKMEVEVSIDEVDAKTREKQYEYSDSSKVLVNWFEHTTEFDGYSMTLFADHDPDSDQMNVHLESEDLDLKLRKRG